MSDAAVLEDEVQAVEDVNLVTRPLEIYTTTEQIFTPTKLMPLLLSSGLEILESEYRISSKDF